MINKDQINHDLKEFDEVLNENNMNNIITFLENDDTSSQLRYFVFCNDVQIGYLSLAPCSPAFVPIENKNVYFSIYTEGHKHTYPDIDFTKKPIEFLMQLSIDPRLKGHVNFVDNGDYSDERLQSWQQSFDDDIPTVSSSV